MVTAEATGAFDRVVSSIRAERQARRDLEDARDALVEALRKLKEEGVPASLIAIRLARALGETLTLEERRRLAAALRQRRSRALRRGVTPDHGKRAGSHGHPSRADPPSVERTLPSAKSEGNMPERLIRRTIEEFEVDEEADKLDEIDEVEEEDEGEEEERPTRRKRRR